MEAKVVWEGRICSRRGGGTGDQHSSVRPKLPTLSVLTGGKLVPGGGGGGKRLHSKKTKPVKRGLRFSKGVGENTNSSSPRVQRGKGKKPWGFHWGGKSKKSDCGKIQIQQRKGRLLTRKR